MIDWIPLFGPVIQAIAMLSGIMAIFYGLRGEVRILRHDIGHLEKQFVQLSEAFSQIGSVLTQVAVQDTRLSMIEKNLDELRHGHGYVKEKRLA